MAKKTTCDFCGVEIKQNPTTSEIVGFDACDKCAKEMLRVLIEALSEAVNVAVESDRWSSDDFAILMTIKSKAEDLQKRLP